MFEEMDMQEIDWNLYDKEAWNGII